MDFLFKRTQTFLSDYKDLILFIYGGSNTFHFRDDQIFHKLGEYTIVLWEWNDKKNYVFTCRKICTDTSAMYDWKNNREKLFWTVTEQRRNNR